MPARPYGIGEQTPLVVEGKEEPPIGREADDDATEEYQLRLCNLSRIMPITPKDSTRVNKADTSSVSRRGRSRRHGLNIKNACIECRKRRAKIGSCKMF